MLQTTTPAGYVDEMDPELVGLLRQEEEEAEERLEGKLLCLHDHWALACSFFCVF